MKVLSIDPGFGRLGIAVVEKGALREKILYSNCLKTPANTSFHQRLLLIGEEIDRMIKKYRPKHLAIEELFFNTNQKTAFQVSEVRGAIVYVALSNKIPVFEYTPLQIKVAVTGYGRSSKKQVTEMLKKIVSIEKPIETDDEFDAIAVGLTHIAVWREEL